MPTDVKLLQQRHLLVVSESGAVAVVTERDGWIAIPEPLAGVVRAALGVED